MNDKELLVFAAKAAGICVEFYETHGREICKKANDYGPNNLWDPLTDDGDALRLAVKLGMEVKIDWAKLQISVWNGCNLWVYEDLSTNSIDPDVEPISATRLAITRAAAEVGKGMLTQEEFILMFPNRFDADAVERAAAEIGKNTST